MLIGCVFWLVWSMFVQSFVVDKEGNEAPTSWKWFHGCLVQCVHWRFSNWNVQIWSILNSCFMKLACSLVWMDCCYCCIGNWYFILVIAYDWQQGKWIFRLVGLYCRSSLTHCKNGISSSIDKDRASYHNKIIEAHNRTKEWDGWDRMSSRGS